MSDQRRSLLVALIVAFVIVGTLDVLRWGFGSYGADAGTFAQRITERSAGCATA